MEPSIPSAARRWAGALCLPLSFVALIVATVFDPLDDSAPAADQLRQAAGHTGQLLVLFPAELVAAALMFGATMAVVGAVRRRGAGLAGAGGVLGALGGVGLTLIGMSHLYLYALASSGTADGDRVLAARDSVAGAIVPLFYAAPLAVVLLCCAAVRAGLVPWPGLVVTGAFVVLEVVPTPLDELPALIAGLVAFGWVGLGILRAGRRAPLAPATAGVTPAAAVA